MARRGIMVDNSELFINASNEKIEQILEAIGSKAETYAKYLCPTVTGRLKNSITHTISGKPSFAYTYEDENRNSFSYTVGSAPTTRGGKTLFLGSNVEYGAKVELGLPPRKSAKPYLKPAITQHNDEYKAMALSILRQ